MRFTYVGNQDGKHTCYCCGTNRSVKYTTNVFAPNSSDLIDVYLCNTCVLKLIAMSLEEES